MVDIFYLISMLRLLEICSKLDKIKFKFTGKKIVRLKCNCFRKTPIKKYFFFL